jgi:broad specificity phosphatase PhoE
MLILVRHGRTPANAAGLLQGRLNQSLDEVGYEQAERVASAVRSSLASVDKVIASPLTRAQQTASAFGLPVHTDERWLEISYGVYEGVAMSKVPRDVWQNWRQDPYFEPEGGESMWAMDQRVREACHDLMEEAKEANVVVVSHVSPMKSAVAWALGVDLGISWRTHLAQAAVCRIDVRDSGPVLVSFNETPAAGM